ncbi:MAG: hypothetical protein GX241_06275 [Ruminococcaceae bacterium]|nr:hypothetical protein [Oscillospiraceae bacterium]
MAQIDELLNELEAILADGKGKAFSSKMTVDVDAIRAVIENIRFNMPEEVRQARALASERREIMTRANREAEMIIEEAKTMSRSLLSESEKRVRTNETETNRRNEELMRDAQKKAKNLIDTAQQKADEIISKEGIVNAAKETADNLLDQADTEMTQKTKEARTLLSEAILRAEQIVLEAEEKAKQVEQEAEEKAKRVKEEAEQKAKSKVAAARRWSYDLKINASSYVDEIVNETEYRVSRSLGEIQKLQGSLIAAAKASNQKTHRADRKQKDIPISKKSTDTDGRSIIQESQEKRKGRQTIVEEDLDMKVIFPKPSIIDIPLSDDPLVKEEDLFF